MNESSRAAAFVTAPFTRLSESEAAEFRARISVIWGCLKFPGDAVCKEELAAGLEGVNRSSCAFALRYPVVLATSLDKTF
jgi:hypothetical protein